MKQSKIQGALLDVLILWLLWCVRVELFEREAAWKKIVSNELSEEKGRSLLFDGQVTRLGRTL